MRNFLSLAQTHFIRTWLWFKERVHDRKAEPWLVVLSFSESFLIPVPVDPFLAAMVIADRARWVWIATLATISSTLGAVAGYIIGFFAFDLIGAWFAHVTDSSAFIERMTALFQDHALALTFAAALTPIPNAPVVIAAGFLGTQILLFTLAWFVARFIRFFGVAYVVYAFGTDSLSRAERVLNIGTVVLILGAIMWFVYSNVQF